MSEEEWFRERVAQELQVLASRLDACVAELQNESKLPLAVPSGTEIRGVLTRKGAIVTNVKVNVQLPGHKAFSLVTATNKRLPEIAVLAASLEKASILMVQANFELDEILRTLDYTMCDAHESTPENFPQTIWAPAGMPHGTCADIKACEHEVKLTIYTYQDRAGKEHYATSTTTAEATDPILSKVYTEAHDVRQEVYRIVRNSYILEYA